MATLLEWPPLYDDHLSTGPTYLQQPSLFNNHLSSTATSLQRPPCYNAHFSSHLSMMATSYFEVIFIFYYIRLLNNMKVK